MWRPRRGSRDRGSLFGRSRARRREQGLGPAQRRRRLALLAESSKNDARSDRLPQGLAEVAGAEASHGQAVLAVGVVPSWRNVVQAFEPSGPAAHSPQAFHLGSSLGGAGRRDLVASDRHKIKSFAINAFSLRPRSRF